MAGTRDGLTETARWHLQCLLSGLRSTERASRLEASFLALVAEGVDSWEAKTMLSKPTVPSGGGGMPALDEGTLKRFPLIAEYLTQTEWEDGSVRETGCVLIVAEDGIWKACMSDKALDRTLWASAASLGGVLEALEKRLSSPTPDWRRRREPGPRRRN